jgi:hypothetical protein
VVAIFLVTALADPAIAYKGDHTRWSVKTCPGLEAVVFIGALAGNELQLEHYRQDVDLVRARLSPEALKSLDHLREFAEISGTLIGPNLALLFSAGPAATLDDVIASAREPDLRLRPNLEKSQYWDAHEWEWFRDETLPDVLTVLQGLKDAGFEVYWQEVAAPKLDLRIDATEKYLQRFDIVPEQERLLGRPLEPDIEVLLLFFSRPYGIRITGQRLASHYSYPMYIQLRTAAHEMFHPPFERADQSIYENLQPLANDPWMLSIINGHDPAIGYNTFPELLDESATQALDQLLADRMGLWLGPGARWRNSDGGMHMLAAAIYQMLLEDDYHETGGHFGKWLDSAIDRGLFAPQEVKRRAALIVGQEAVDRWPRSESPAR